MWVTYDSFPAKFFSKAVGSRGSAVSLAGGITIWHDAPRRRELSTNLQCKLSDLGFAQVCQLEMN